MFRDEENNVLPMNWEPSQNRNLEKGYVSRAKPKIFQDFAGASLYTLIPLWLHQQM